MRWREDLIIRPRESRPPCGMPMGPSADVTVKCGKPADRRVQSGCSHEHITGGVVCPEHAEKLLHGTGTIWCRQCAKIDGHRCPVVTREVEL